MKTIITSKKTQAVLGILAAIAVCQTAQAQHIDDVSGATGSGSTWTLLGNPVTGDLTVQYSNTTWGGTTGPTKNWASVVSFDHGNSGNDDVVSFDWKNQVSSFEFTIWDWDGGGSTAGKFAFDGVDRVTLLGVGDSIYKDPGFTANTYTTSGNTISYDTSLANILNSDPGTGIRIRLDNIDGSAFSKFSMNLVSGLSYNGFGGTMPGGYTPVPEPSSAILASLGLFAFIVRRKRR